MTSIQLVHGKSPSGGGGDDESSFPIQTYDGLSKIGVRESDIPDIAQHVLVKIHQNWEKLSTKPVALWLETICRQQAAEHYRLYRNRFEIPEANVGEDIAVEDDLHAEFERHELDQIVERVLATMDPEQRDLLMRREFQNESLGSIAKTYGIARNTAYARIAEAKKIFRLRAERMLGEKGTWMLLLPFGADAASLDWDVTPEFVEAVHLHAWPGFARAIGYDESNPPALAARHDKNDALPSKTRRIRVELPGSPKRWIRAFIDPLILLGTAGIGAIGGALFWPHDLPLIARHMPATVRPVVVQERVKTDADSEMPPPLPSSSAVQRVVIAMPAHSTAQTAPELERELSELERARKLLAQRQHAEALDVLRQHAREFPRSDLAATRQRYVVLAEEGLRKATHRKID